MKHYYPFGNMKQVGDSFTFTKHDVKHSKHPAYATQKQSGWKCRHEKVEDGVRVTWVA